MSDNSNESYEASHANGDVDDQKNDQKNDDETERGKKAVEEIKAANDVYNQKLKALNEKRAELNSLQVEAFEALQKATSLNEQFNVAVNTQLLKERAGLQDEVKKLRSILGKKK